MDQAMWDARYAASQLWNLTPDEAVVTALSQVPRGRALDLGSGDGRHALWLASRGWRVTAVDSSHLAISNLQARAAVLGLAVEAVMGDATRWAPRRHGYDLALLVYVQLSLPALKLALRTAAAALSEGGQFFLLAHDRSNLGTGYGGPQDPDVLSTPDEVAGILTDLGFTVTRAEVVSRKVTTDSGLRFAYDHIVEATRGPIADG